MNGTKWSITQDGTPMTWTVVQRQWSLAHPREAAPMQTVSPLEFDVAEELSSVQAQELLMWLKSWMPATGHGLRLVPSVSTHELRAMLPHEGGKPVRV